MKKTALTSTFVLLSAVIAHAGLVAHFDFEEGTGSTTASAVGGWAGPFSGDPQWELANLAPVPSGTTGALVFDGTEDRIVTDFAGVAGSADRSIAFWVNTTNSSQNSGTVAWGDTTANGHKWHTRINNNAGNGLVGAIRTEIDGSFEIGDVNIADGQWHHVASVYDGAGVFGSGQVRHYIDGVLVGLSGSGSDTVVVDTFVGTAILGELAPTIIGGRQQGTLQSFTGMMDEVRIYDHALTQAEVTTLATGIPIINSFTANAESIEAGGTVTLSWEVDPNFDTIAIDNGVGDVAANTVGGSGSINLMPAATTTYTITGTREGEMLNREITVLVGEAPIINRFEVAGLDTITAGDSTTLAWSTFGADTLTLSPGSDVTGTTELVVAPNDTTVYTLTATNASGSSTAQVTVTVLPPRLIAHFDFEEGSGMTTADVISGHIGNLDPADGTGPIWDTSDVPPLLAGTTASIDFDGTGDRIVVTGYKVNELSGTTSRTVMAWVKSRGVSPVDPDDMGIVAFGQDQAGDKWIFRSQDDNGPIPGTLRVEVNGGYIIGSTVIVDNAWHHVAMTFEDDGTPDVQDIILYVDGQPEVISESLDEVIHTDTVNGIDLRIGDDHSNRKWDGWIDDVRIYNYALTLEEIGQARLGGSPVSFQITKVDHGGSNVILTWNSRPGRSYSIDTITELGTGTWAELVDGVPSDGAETTFLDDSIDPNAKTLYYRIREE